MVGKLPLLWINLSGNGTLAAACRCIESNRRISNPLQNHGVRQHYQKNANRHTPLLQEIRPGTPNVR
jgi:hypothetical protein